MDNLTKINRLMHIIQSQTQTINNLNAQLQSITKSQVSQPTTSAPAQTPTYFNWIPVVKPTVSQFQTPSLSELLINHILNVTTVLHVYINPLQLNVIYGLSMSYLIKTSNYINFMIAYNEHACTYDQYLFHQNELIAPYQKRYGQQIIPDAPHPDILKDRYDTHNIDKWIAVWAIKNIFTLIDTGRHRLRQVNPQLKPNQLIDEVTIENFWDPQFIQIN